MDNKQRKLILIAGCILLVVVMIIGIIVQQTNRTRLETKTTTSVDPITGETIVNVEGKSPETNNQPAQPSIIGSDAVYGLFGDEEVFTRLQDIVLYPTYAKHSLIRISKDSVNKVVRTTDGITTIIVNFDIYLDKDNVKKDYFTVTYNQETTNIDVVIKGDYTNTTFQTSTAGDL